MTLSNYSGILTVYSDFMLATYSGPSQKVANIVPEQVANFIPESMATFLRNGRPTWSGIRMLIERSFDPGLKN
jgi:hypothetical protein